MDGEMMLKHAAAVFRDREDRYGPAQDLLDQIARQSGLPHETIAKALGPTASGKTDLAEALARLFDAQLINADAFQIYRGLEIGTAKPVRPEKYRLVDIPISNCLNSGINRIFVLTQFNTASLHRHIQSTYRFDPFNGGMVEILSAEHVFRDYQFSTDQKIALPETA